MVSIENALDRLREDADEPNKEELLEEIWQGIELADADEVRQEMAAVAGSTPP